MGKPDMLSQQVDHRTRAGNNNNIVLLKPELFAIKEICQGNWQGMQEDAVAQAARMLQANKGKGVKSVHTDKWHDEGGLLTFRGRIYMPNIPELQQWIVKQHHDSHIAGHPGQWKTLELVSHNYWWPQMSWYMGAYTSTCDLCLQTKPHHLLSTSRQRRSSIAVKLAGPCIWPTLTSRYTTSQDGAWASQTRCLSEQTTELERAIMITSSSSNRSSLPFMLWKVWQSKGMR